MSVTNMNWFVTQVDRDFKTRYYGEAQPRLYTTQTDYILITGVLYKDGILVVKDNKGNLIELNDEPNNTLFENSLYKEWKEFDNRFGKFDDDRTDYEPWAYNSIKALACELKLCNEKGVQMYHNKKFVS